MWLTPVERACALARRLAGKDGWWSTSFEADAVGTCERLLRDRDLLVAWGWRGQPVSARLAGLWEATADAPVGFSDRVLAVSAAVAERGVDIERVRTTSPLATLAPAWRDLFARLAHSGTRIEEEAAPAERAPGDLGRAQMALKDTAARAFMPQGDGSLTLLRPHGPLAAADEVAASLAAAASVDGVVVVGADELLDPALARLGLPRAGGRAAAPASTMTVRLALEAAFTPLDPADLHALLCLDPGPVPRTVASRLVGALRRFPGRDTPVWRDALTAALLDIDAERRPRVATRLSTLLTSAVPRDDKLPAAEIALRLQAVAAWARGRSERDPSLVAAVRTADAVRRTIELLGAQALTRIELRRLCDDVEAGNALAGEAGLAHVAEPGAVLAPAATIVWWGFTRDRAPRTQRLRLSEAERGGLTQAGVAVPDTGAMMEAEAARWRRPLELSTEALVLVCPATDEKGERCFPHPLWDELIAALPDQKHAAKLEVRALARPARALRQRANLRPVPAPAASARAPVPLALREKESPSSLEKLLGCSLAWTLEHRGQLKAGLSERMPAPGPLLYGNLAHHFLAQVFGNGALPAEEARARANALLKRELDGLCESLGLPRYQVERAALRQAIARSAAGLGALLAETGATVRGTELEASATLCGVTVAGKADLVLSAPDVVLDLKWGASSNRQRLASGTALQLAAYAELFRTEGRYPEVAYFALRAQELLGEEACTLPSARIPGQHLTRDVWRAAEAAIGARVAELARGELFAPGADADVLGALANGVITIAPPCEYCGFGGLCGRKGRA
jgi:hypothetical protein